MNQITISTLGNYATMRGGVTNLEVIQACECTGFMGVALGGGHGFRQGYYELVADNILDARAVLINGEMVNVSASDNLDLF